MTSSLFIQLPNTGNRDNSVYIVISKQLHHNKKYRKTPGNLKFSICSDIKSTMMIEIQYTDLRSLETQSAQDPILISQDDWFKYNSRSNIDNDQMQPTSLPSIGPSASPYPTAESTTLMQPISLPSIQPSASPYPTAESAALMQPISLPLIQPSTSPYLQPARKHKHGEWNLHYEKKSGVERNSWMHLYPTTMFREIVIQNHTPHVEISWNWIQELKTEERIFRYIQDLVEWKVISAYRK